MFRHLIIIGTLLLMVGSAAGQDVLAKAILVEEGEHDPRAALPLYEKAVLESEGKATQPRALLRLGLCLRKIGKEDEARRAFQQAAALGGAAGEQAKVALSGGATFNQDAKVAARVRSAAMQLKDPKLEKQAREELRWIGRPAAPYLAQVIEGESHDLHFITRAVGILTGIGGADVVKFFERVSKSDDALVRRAVVRGFHDPEGEDAALVAAMKAFLVDEDPRVRAGTAATFADRLGFAEVMKLLDDPEVSVRRDVLARNGDRHDWLERNVTRGGNVAAWCARVRRLFDDPSEDVRANAVVAAGMPQCMDTPDGQRNLLAILERPELRKFWGDNQVRTFDRWCVARLKEATEVVSAAEVLSVAKELGPLETRNQRSWAAAGNTLAFFARACSTRWGRAEFEDVAQLASLKYDDASFVHSNNTRYSQASWTGAWMVKVAGDDQVSTVAGALVEFPWNTAVIEWLAQRRLTAADVMAVRRALARHLAAGTGKGSNRVDAPLVAMMALFLGNGSSEAHDAVVETLARGPEFADEVFSALLARDAVPPELLARLVGVGGGHGDHRVGRHTLVEMLVAARAAPQLDALAVAYEKGMMNSRFERGTTPTRVGRVPKPRRRTRHDSIFEDLLKGPVPFAEARLVEVVEACLATKVPQVWYDLGSAVTKYDVPPAVAEPLCRTLMEAPVNDAWRYDMLAELVDHARRAPSLPELARAGLRRLAGRYQKNVLNALDADLVRMLEVDVRAVLESDDSSVVSTAVKALGRHGSQDSLAAIESMTSHRVGSVRSVALEHLVRRDRERAIEAALRLLTDDDPRVRSQACRQCGVLVDKRAVPKLLATLRDHDATVREAAQQALRGIDFYYNQQERWRKWMEGSGLEAPSAAEALLEQAKDGKTKQVRLMAIRSLGTLGVAETLPILIQYSQDDDADIAKAATEAIAKINAKK